MLKSYFKPSKQAIDLLYSGGILDVKEKPENMVERVAKEIFSVERKFNTSPKKKKQLIASFIKLIDQKEIIPSTPILMNAGRFGDRPLSACISPPNEIKSDLNKIKWFSTEVHRKGMGTGYSFDEINDPVKTLYTLNDFAVRGSRSRNELRPVGNMATLSVRHRDIERFIFSKVNKRHDDWKFNISVSIDNAFMDSLINKEVITLSDGRVVSASKIFKMIASAAHQCADPGIIFVDRLNSDNPTPKIGLYKTVAPCGEVGLLGGEFCQFIYINIGHFITEDKKIDYQKLDKAIIIVTRALDNSLELSIERSSSSESKHIMTHKRKIGIGICGFADLLTKMSLPYGEQDSRRVAEDIMSFINYRSKLASIELAGERGPCLAMLSKGMSDYNNNPGYLEKKYAGKDTATVTETMWRKMAKKIRSDQLLRNSTTTALPPTGRSARIIDASTGIEPFFSLINYSGKVEKSLITKLKSQGIYSLKMERNIKNLGRIPNSEKISEKLRRVYKTALEIDFTSHLLMAHSFQKYVDESISKTINIPSDTKKEIVERIFIQSFKLGLKGVTIYRSGSKKHEPRRLSN